MITVEKAIKESKTRNAVGDQDKKKSMRKKLLIGTAVVAGVYFGYVFFIKNKNGKTQTINP